VAGVAFVVLFAVAGCGAAETRSFEGTWSATGSRRTLDLEPGHKASIFSRLRGQPIGTGSHVVGTITGGPAAGRD
jgi:hypothetical protein